MAPRALGDVAGLTHRRHRAAQGQHPVVRDGGRSPPRPRHHRRSRGGGHPDRAALRAAGDGSPRHSGHRPRLAGDVQHARGHRRAGGSRLEGAQGVRLMSELSDLYQEVILDHNRRPHNFRVIDPATRDAGRLQPALRRSPDALPDGQGRRHRRRGVPGLRLRDLEGVRVADDRRGEGQDASNRRARCSSGSTR